MKNKTYKFKIFSLLITFFLVCTIFAINTNANSSRSESSFIQKDVHYYTHDELTDVLEDLYQEYSDIFYYESIGKSHEGRDLWLVKISDNVTNDEEDEPEVFFTWDNMKME
ncbi:MAG: hypothetical protein KAW45_04665 [Thermoplasmatales archaeon]|nr:hypothetical protein [Thermoplasmatales archaeon]